MSKFKVYIASPYTIGDAGSNVKKQMDCAHLLMDCGFIPFAPLMSHFLHMNRPRPYEEWMEWDFEWVKSCDALLRLSGTSPGADREIFCAEKNYIPVFYTLEDLLLWADARKSGYTNKIDSEYNIRFLEIDSRLSF
jgi:hypothetical protein